MCKAALVFACLSCAGGATDCSLAEIQLIHHENGNCLTEMPDHRVELWDCGDESEEGAASNLWIRRPNPQYADAGYCEFENVEFHECLTWRWSGQYGGTYGLTYHVGGTLLGDSCQLGNPQQAWEMTYGYLDIGVTSQQYYKRLGASTSSENGIRPRLEYHTWGDEYMFTRWDHKVIRDLTPATTSSAPPPAPTPTPTPAPTPAPPSGISDWLKVIMVVVFFCGLGALGLYYVKKNSPGCQTFFPSHQALLMDDDADLQSDIVLPGVAKAPSHWVNQDLFGEDFDDFYNVDANLTWAVQQMFNSTWKDIVTRDRKGGRKPEWLEVSSVTRFEDRHMYASYYAERERIRQRRRNMKPICMLDGNPITGRVLTDAYTAILTAGEGLDNSVNEHFLFHGTSPEAAAHIAENGFRINLAGSNAGTLFGRGAYFAECCSKADEYATTGAGFQTKLGRFGHQAKDEYAILICRVIMGDVLRVYRAKDRPKIESMLRAEQIDSVLGDREEAVGTYREFIVYKEAQIYPAYRVLYKRQFDKQGPLE